MTKPQSKIDQKVKEIIYYMESVQNKGIPYTAKFNVIKEIVTS